MNVVLSVYSQVAFKEFWLPSANNVDYTITLQSDFFHLKENVNLQLEVLDGKWSLKNGVHYMMRKKSGSHKEQYLEDEDIIHIHIAEGKEIMMLVKYVNSVFHPYEKYRLADVNKITIGAKEDNDIAYDYRNMVSRRHATLERAGKGFKIINEGKNGTYVNSRRMEQEQLLEFGAYINIIGLHLVYLGDYLAVDVAGSGAEINTNKLQKSIPISRNLMQDAIPVSEDITQDMIQEFQSHGKTIYHRAPRTFKELDTEPIEIESPPQLNEPKRQPLLLTIGPSLTMALPMIMGCILMATASGTQSVSRYVGVVMAVMSACIGTLWSCLNLRQQKKTEKEIRQQRFASYNDYLQEKTEVIRAKYEETAEILADMYPRASECLAYDESKGVLWNRNPTHADYLKHRLGIGDIPFQIPLQVSKKKFSVYEDELADKPLVIKENYEKLYQVPVALDLAEHNLVGIVGGEKKKGAIEVAKVIAAQIAANNCYTDVKMGFIYNQTKFNETAAWKFAKWLPHVWSEDKKIRYLAADADQTSDVFYELTRIFRGRTKDEEEADKTNERLPKPYYVLFISDPELLEGELIARYVLEKNQMYGLTTFILAKHYEELPNTCDFIIENTTEFQGMYDVAAGESQKQRIAFDHINDRELEKFSRYLASLQVREIEKGGEIPNQLSFFEMFSVARPEDLPVKDNWVKNRTYDNIRGMIGAKAGGAPCYLDVHEKYHGPHGLIAGTTGSGKSETLQTYLLSLAVNYSPDDIAFFIIDYKGGGMANLFEGLPHLAGQISNLSGNLVKRAMISIKSENRRRQRIFNEHGVNNINLYTKLYKSGEAALPVPHLFIIIDEFAELKREEADFMRELISVAQVGRSLGVHLILATQKTGGTVDDNIWSNSRFRLCLRVQDRQDSMDMLHKPDAAYLLQAGRCYLQVGSDEIYEQFQSGYSGAAYEENVDTGNTEIAKLLNVNGTVEMTGNSVKLSQKKKVEYRWIEQLIAVLNTAQTESEIQAGESLEDKEKMSQLIQAMYKEMQRQELDYSESGYNSNCLCNFVELYAKISGENETDNLIRQILAQAAVHKIKLPQKKEKTQLDAVKKYLAIAAQKLGYEYHMQMWMPVLPDCIYLEEFKEFQNGCYQDGSWPKRQSQWSLEIVIGKLDDPENQNQMPLLVDFAKTGHLAIFGMVASGRSTLMQTMIYALIHRYTPEDINIYGLDFSSRMMSAFEDAPHVGGIMYENDLHKIGCFFHMLNRIAETRKELFCGGNYSQYVRMHGVTLPAVILFIDNYASFKEKTNQKYEDMLIKFAKEGVSQGIFLVVSDSGVGINDLSPRVCENINTSLCLQLQDKYEYIDRLHVSHLEKLPESGIRGRGLAVYEDQVLEYQTALCAEAENDYERMKYIGARCAQMKGDWKGKTARKTPEIPKTPVWTKFHELEDYKELLAKKGMLPVAYDAESALLYGINLRHIYCYMAYGTGRSGKTNFLKVCIQAAKEKNGQVCIIDPAPDIGTGELEGYKDDGINSYASDEETVFRFFQELTPVFVERNKKKLELDRRGHTEDEIWDIMGNEQPYFIFIAHMERFIDLIHKPKYEMKGFLNTILTKGRFHNIYFFSEISMEEHKKLKGDTVYDIFTSYKKGIHFGGDMEKNTVLDFNYISYMERSKKEKPGIGWMPKADDEDTTKIVVPMARR